MSEGERAMNRRSFLRGLGAATAAAVGGMSGVAWGAAYPYLGRTKDYAPFRLLDAGRKIQKLETWTLGPYGVVRVTTDDGLEGWGQLSSYEVDITATVFHRMVARHALGADPADIDGLVDRVIDGNMKFPWTFVCRALAGLDTAIWDLYGKAAGKPVCVLLGGQTHPFPVYGSSMRRDISPEAEAERMVRLREEQGFKAFKIRVGVPVGHDGDASPGRTERIIPWVRKALGDEVMLLADGNSCYTPPKAMEVGRRLEDANYYWFEEPCPYWELEWTAEVAADLKIKVAGGEQDNDLAQWRRMLRMKAVDVAQPDICYLGGFTRSLRVARLAREASRLVVPHSSHLSLITVFSLHLMAAIRNAGPVVEYTIEPESFAGPRLYEPALSVKEGRVGIPEEPGWGVRMNPEWLARANHQETRRG